jgi:hypothetical protein
VDRPRMFVVLNDEHAADRLQGGEFNPKQIPQCLRGRLQPWNIRNTRMKALTIVPPETLNEGSSGGGPPDFPDLRRPRLTSISLRSGVNPSPRPARAKEDPAALSRRA